MKKEKTIKTYQRRTKSGKMVTVKQHTAKYDAAEKAREMAKKKGAGSELEELKKKGKAPVQLEIDFDKEDSKEKDKAIVEEVKKSVKKETEKNSKSNKKEAPKKVEKKVSAKESKTTKSSEPAFTAAEFKEWYRGTGSEADKKVAKALRKQLGRAGYNKLEDEAIDNYSSRGHLKMFKSLEGLMVSKEDSKTQLSEANKMSRRVTSLEEKLKQAKDIHSGLRRNDPKKLKYAEKIQKLQKDLMATKKASDNQNKISDEVNTEKSSAKGKKATGKGEDIGTLTGKKAISKKKELESMGVQT